MRDEVTEIWIDEAEEKRLDSYTHILYSATDKALYIGTFEGCKLERERLERWFKRSGLWIGEF